MKQNETSTRDTQTLLSNTLDYPSNGTETWQWVTTFYHLNSGHKKSGFRSSGIQMITVFKNSYLSYGSCLILVMVKELVDNKPIWLTSILCVSFSVFKSTVSVRLSVYGCWVFIVHKVVGTFISSSFCFVLQNIFSLSSERASSVLFTMCLF